MKVKYLTMADRILQADGLSITTPKYKHSIPGV